MPSESKYSSSCSDSEGEGEFKSSSPPRSLVPGNAPDGKRLMSAVHALSDLLLDDIMPSDIYLGGDDEAEAKADDDSDDSPAVALFKEVREHCKSSLPLFVTLLQKTPPIPPGEYTLECTQAHDAYLSAVEEHLSRCLGFFQYTLEGFMDDLRVVLSPESFGTAEEVMWHASGKELLEVVECVTKFER